MHDYQPSRRTSIRGVSTPAKALARAVALLLACGFVLSLVGCAVSDKISAPGNWAPLKPLRIDEPLNWLTPHKLSRLSGDPQLCKSVLQQARMRYQPIPDHETATGCGYRDAVRVLSTSVNISAPFILSCRSAVALAMWEHHIVLPAARLHFGEPVVRLEHIGSYACRNVYGNNNASLSRHASADALDVSGFVLKSGKRIRVERDWRKDDPTGRFLNDVRDGACRVFDGVLSPEYNEAHRDHFHLDLGGPRLCR